MVRFRSEMYFQTFVIVKFCLLISVQCHSGESFHPSSFDFTEVESIHYDVNIGGVPVLDQELAAEVSRKILIL